MNTFKNNVTKSFELAKNDVNDLRKNYIELKAKYENLMTIVSKLQSNKTTTVIKKVVSRKAKKYVATKDGSKFHVENCPFALNIKPKNKVTFKSTTSALNRGLKPCKCIHK